MNSVPLDQNAAKDFYSSLFGWQANDMPMGPSGVYTIFRLQGRDAAAGYELNPQQRAQGVPPHWLPYIAVESADASAARVTQLGGTVIMPPFDVFDAGRMAVIQEPDRSLLRRLGTEEEHGYRHRRSGWHALLG